MSDMTDEDRKREPGLYWASREGAEPSVFEWDGDSWYQTGSELPLDREGFRQVSERLLPP